MPANPKNKMSKEQLYALEEVLMEGSLADFYTTLADGGFDIVDLREAMSNQLFEWDTFNLFSKFKNVFRKNSEDWSDCLRLKYRVWKSGQYKRELNRVEDYFNKLGKLCRITSMDFDLPIVDDKDELTRGEITELQIEIHNGDRKDLDDAVKALGKIFSVVEFSTSLFTDIGAHRA